MSKTSCEIIFENNNTNRVYYSGDTIRGTVIITLQKEKIVKGIYITFVGNAECVWNESSGDKRIAYRGKECYLSTRIYFLGEEDAEPITLKPDVYRYTFSLRLSDEFPSSLEGTFGHIRYSCFVTINVPIWPDKIFAKAFTVIKPVNLNEMFELKEAVCMEKRKEFYLCCLLFCFKTLPLNIIARLPASGFAPGQRIDLALDIENQSSERIRNFKVELFKIIVYKSNQLSTHRKAERVSLVQHSTSGCDKNQDVQYKIGIVVPSVPPTDLSASSVCRVKYEIQITAEVNCCHNKPELTIPLTIGSIPFIENYHRTKRRPTVVGIDDKSMNKLAENTAFPREILAENPPIFVEAHGTTPKNKDDKPLHIPLYPNFRD